MLLGTQEHIEIWELLPEGGGRELLPALRSILHSGNVSRHPEGDYCPGATHQADSQSLAARTHATLASLFDDVVQERDLAEQKADLAEQQVACLEESLQVAKKMRAASEESAAAASFWSWPEPKFFAGQSVHHFWCPWFETAEEPPKMINTKNRPKWYVSEVMERPSPTQAGL